MKERERAWKRLRADFLKMHMRLRRLVHSAVEQIEARGAVHHNTLVAMDRTGKMLTALGKRLDRLEKTQ